MVSIGTIYRCQNCQTEVEVLNVQATGGPLVCCEIEMKEVDDFDKIYEKEAFDDADFEWN